VEFMMKLPDTPVRPTPPISQPGEN
jgi:hypothetical protein